MLAIYPGIVGDSQVGDMLIINRRCFDGTDAPGQPWLLTGPTTARASEWIVLPPRPGSRTEHVAVMTMATVSAFRRSLLVWSVCLLAADTNLIPQLDHVDPPGRVRLGGSGSKIRQGVRVLRMLANEERKTDHSMVASKVPPSMTDSPPPVMHEVAIFTLPNYLMSVPCPVGEEIPTLSRQTPTRYEAWYNRHPD